MKSKPMKKLSLALIAIGGISLTACNGGGSSGSAGVSGSGAAIQAQATSNQAVLTTDSCVSGKFAVSSTTNVWYTQAKISLTNTCSDDQKISDKVISFTAQDVSGAAVNLAKVTNWYVNGGQYDILFANNGGSAVSSSGTNPADAVLHANQTIEFAGDMNLSGRVFDLTSAQSSFKVSSVAPEPIVKTGSMTVNVDTTKAGCSTTTICNITVDVKDPNNALVASFVVPSGNLGAVYTQQIQSLPVNNYTLSASAVSGDTISYTPSQTPAVVADTDTAVSINYVKPAPIGKVGQASIVLPVVVPQYTGDLWVRILNAKESNVVVASYSMKQGATLLTEALPISDTTHAYKVKVQGVGDPASGTYYIESGLRALAIKTNKTTTLNIPFKLSTATKRNMNLTVSGLQSGDSAAVNFQDAAGTYALVGYAGLTNAKVTYKFVNKTNVAYSLKAGGSYEVNPIENTILMNANKNLGAAFKVATVAPDVVASGNVVTVYALIDNPADLKKFTDQLQAVAKPDFNRVIFSFARPTFPVYTKGSLANSGLMGYFGVGDGKGVDAFNQLKAAINLAKQKQIQPFISVGGWNYSCNFAEYGTKCGGVDKATDPVNGFDFDWFPEASTTDGTKSYQNLVDLVHDLGAQGIDFDYEEFWHADKYARDWSKWEANGPWTLKSSVGAAYSNPTYDNLVALAGGQGVATDGTKAAVMPDTVAKMDNILKAMFARDDTYSKKLLWSTAAPAPGGRPIMGFTYGDVYTPYVGAGTPNNYGINEVGGIWWTGNMKGLWYHLAQKDLATVNRFDSIGLMTYDVCNGKTAEWSEIKCAPYAKTINPSTGAVTEWGPLDLPGQVNAYVDDYNNWLKATTTRNAAFSGGGTSTTDPLIFRPAKYKVNPRIQFGYEVNQPAFPKDVNGQLQLLASDVTTINSQQKTKTGGVIIWQLYSQQNTAVSGSAKITQTIQDSCKTFLANDSRYDCNVNLPAAQ